MKALLALTVLTLSLACASAPPTASPPAQVAFRNTQAIKSLDLLRDIAIDANAQKPALISTETTRKIVLFHQSTLKVIDATAAGWQATVIKGLEELVKNLPPNEQKLLTPYITLTLSVLKGLQ